MDPAENNSSRRILLIGIDGARWDIIAEEGEGTFLQEKAREGRLCAMCMESPTWSGPGWSSILTGTTHAQHGVRDNTLVGSRLWNYPDLLSRAFFKDQSTRTFAAAGWPVLVDPQGPGPVIHPRMDQQYAGLHRVVVRDGETLGYERIDAEIASVAKAALADKGFDVGFVYFCDIDDAGHIYGLEGCEYRAAIRRVDQHVRTLCNEATRRADELGEDWLVVITTDHGHRDEGGHGGGSDRERESWVVAWSPSGQLPDWPEDIAPHELSGYLLAER